MSTDPLDSPTAAQPATAAWIKPVAEYGPLAAFLIAYARFGLMTATAVLMAATFLALALSWLATRKVPWLTVLTAVLVGVFGGLTLYLHDATFIKMKPTIVEGLFAVTLLGGRLMGRSLLKPLLGSVWALTDTGWQILSLRFGLFFASMAALNELVWRTQSTSFWVGFKVFGLMGLTMAFTLAQVPLIRRHQMPEEGEA